MSPASRVSGSSLLNCEYSGWSPRILVMLYPSAAVAAATATTATTTASRRSSSSISTERERERRRRAVRCLARSGVERTEHSLLLVRWWAGGDARAESERYGGGAPQLSLACLALCSCCSCSSSGMALWQATRSGREAGAPTVFVTKPLIVHDNHENAIVFLALLMTVPCRVANLDAS